MDSLLVSFGCVYKFERRGEVLHTKHNDVIHLETKNGHKRRGKTPLE